MKEYHVMDLRRLEHFLTVLETGSFGSAARTLGITQSGLTKSIQTLEDNVGVPLFLRHSRGVEPTKYGKTLAQHATLMHAQANRALNEIDAVKNGNAGSLSIGVTPSWLMEEVLPKMVSNLTNARPGLKLTVMHQVSSKVYLEVLIAGGLDMFIGTEQDLSEKDDIEFLPLMTDVHGVIVRKGHPLLEKNHHVIADFEPYGWVRREEGTHNGRRLEALYFEAGLPLPTPTIQSNSIPFTLATVASTDYLSASRKADIDASHEPIMMLDRPFQWTRSIGLMRRKNEPLSEAGQNLIDDLKQIFNGQT
jgi:DNA-binding transcriptional LysR family regulator